MELVAFCLPEIAYPLSIDTVGKMLALGHGLRMACNTYRCGYARDINLVRVARRHGMDYSCLRGDLLEVIWCPRCRAAGRSGRDIAFTHEPLTAARSDWPRKAPEPADPFARQAPARD